MKNIIDDQVCKCLRRRALSFFIFVALTGGGALKAPAATQVPTMAWVKRAGGATEDYGWGVAIDAAQNAGVAGHYTSPAEFDGVNPPSFGGIDLFLAKYDSAGELIWVKGAGGPGDDEARSVATDSEGNFYLTGSFTSPATFGSLTLQNSASSTFYLAKYDPNGEVIWIRNATGDGDSEGHAVTIDIFGNIWVAGFFNGDAKFENSTVTSHGGADVFLAKYDPSGHALWVRSGGGAATDDATAVAVDRFGNGVLAGNFVDGAVFGSTTLSNYPGGNFFAAKYDGEGRLLWVKNSGGADTFSVNAVGGAVSDFQGNIYLSGVYGGAPSVGRFLLPTAIQGDIFVIKYSPSGEALWARSFGSPGPDHGRCAAIDPNGDLYVAGYFYESMDFDSFHLTSTNHAEPFLIKMNSNGKVQAAWQPGGSAYKAANGLSVSADGTLYVTGFFRGTTAFGNVTLTNLFVSNRDVFVTRVNGTGFGPRLTISPGAAGQALVSWPAIATGYRLESGTVVGTNGNWSTVTNRAGQLAGWNVLTNVVGTNRFFRLRGF